MTTLTPSPPPSTPSPSPTSTPFTDDYPVQTPTARYAAIHRLTSLVVSAFFDGVRVVGMDNLPARGPVLLVGNHKNQFMDGFMMNALVRRPLRFVVAEKSTHLPVIGTVSKW